MPEPFADAEAEFCRLIGAFLMEFSQLETMLQARLAQAIELPEEFSNIIMSAFDFARLCAVTEAILITEQAEREGEIRKIFNECKRLNEDRVRVAHGLITHDLDGSFAIRAVSRSSFKEAWHFGNGELQGLIDEAQGLMKRVLLV
jgi:hypothetical protein